MSPIYSQVEEDLVIEEKKAEEKLPYAVARGDGSTGGGGLAMPKVTAEEDQGLRRPKVGAEMPVGRPSWFRVPGPSQGKHVWVDNCRWLSRNHPTIHLFIIRVSQGL
jgi:hypothetical protein